MTKYEHEKAMMQEREKRKQNISELRKKLDDAKLLLSVINGKDFESIQEKHIVRGEVARLSVFLADEEKAFKATFEDEETANQVLVKLGL